MKKMMIAVLLFTLPIKAVADTTPATPDMVKLNYNWQAGIEARVAYKFDQIKSVNGKNTNTKMTGEWMMTTAKHKEGLKVDYKEPKFSISSDESQMGTRMQKLMEKLSAITPSYIINKGVELLDVVGLEEMRMIALKEVDNWFADEDPKVKEKITQMVQAMLSEAQLRAQVQQDWNRDVGQWLGAEFEAGYAYSLEYETPVPMIGNAKIPFKGEYSYLGKTVCNDKDKKERCVKLAYKSQIDSEGAKIFLQKMFEKMGVPKGEAEKISMTIDYEIELITDPNTLYPYSVKEIKTVKAPAPEGQPGSEQVDVKSYSYTYKFSKK